MTWRVIPREDLPLPLPPEVEVLVREDGQAVLVTCIRHLPDRLHLQVEALARTILDACPPQE